MSAYMKSTTYKSSKPTNKNLSNIDKIKQSFKVPVSTKNSDSKPIFNSLFNSLEISKEAMSFDDEGDSYDVYKSLFSQILKEKTESENDEKNTGDVLLTLNTTSSNNNTTKTASIVSKENYRGKNINRKFLSNRLLDISQNMSKDKTSFTPNQQKVSKEVLMNKLKQSGESKFSSFINSCKSGNSKISVKSSNSLEKIIKVQPNNKLQAKKSENKTQKNFFNSVNFNSNSSNEPQLKVKNNSIKKQNSINLNKIDISTNKTNSNFVNFERLNNEKKDNTKTIETAYELKPSQFERYKKNNFNKNNYVKLSSKITVNSPKSNVVVPIKDPMINKNKLFVETNQNLRTKIKDISNKKLVSVVNDTYLPNISKINANTLHKKTPSFNAPKSNKLISCPKTNNIVNKETSINKTRMTITSKQKNTLPLKTNFNSTILDPSQTGLNTVRNKNSLTLNKIAKKPL